MTTLQERYGPLCEEPSVHDLRGLRRAYEAALMSDHPDTQVGAYLSTGDMGWNRQYDDHQPRGTDYRWSRVHAEEDALLNAAAYGHSTQGATLYAPWAACTRCSTRIIAAGVTKVVTHVERELLTDDKWLDEVFDGVGMLLRNEVEVLFVSHHFGIKLRCHGREVVL